MLEEIESLINKNLDQLKLEESNMMKVVLDSNSADTISKIQSNPLFSTATNLVIINNTKGNRIDSGLMRDLKAHFGAQKTDSSVIIITNNPDEKSFTITSHDTIPIFKISLEKYTTESGFQQKTFSISAIPEEKDHPYLSKLKIDLTQDNRIIECEQKQTVPYRDDNGSLMESTLSQEKVSPCSELNYNSIVGCIKDVFGQVEETFTDLS